MSTRSCGRGKKSSTSQESWTRGDEGCCSEFCSHGQHCSVAQSYSPHRRGGHQRDCRAAAAAAGCTEALSKRKLQHFNAATAKEGKLSRDQLILQRMASRDPVIANMVNVNLGDPALRMKPPLPKGPVLQPAPPIHPTAAPPPTDPAINNPPISMQQYLSNKAMQQSHAHAHKVDQEKNHSARGYREPETCRSKPDDPPRGQDDDSPTLLGCGGSPPRTKPEKPPKKSSSSKLKKKKRSSRANTGSFAESEDDPRANTGSFAESEDRGGANTGSFAESEEPTPAGVPQKKKKKKSSSRKEVDGVVVGADGMPVKKKQRKIGSFEVSDAGLTGDPGSRGVSFEVNDENFKSVS